MSNKSIAIHLTNGIINENPVLVLLMVLVLATLHLHPLQTVFRTFDYSGTYCST